MSNVGNGQGQSAHPKPNRAQRRSRKRSRTLVGASLVALSGLASGYLQVLRTPAAYASPTQCGADVTSRLLLGAAIEDFNDGGCDTIYITGTFTMDDTVPIIDFSFSSDTLTISGDDTIDGAGQYRPFDVVLLADDTLTVTGLTLTNASSARPENFNRYEGGALSVRSDGSSGYGTVILEGLTVSDSTAQDRYGEGVRGGGMYLDVASAALTDVALLDDSTPDSPSYISHGGAAYIEATVGPVEFTRVTAIGNSTNSTAYSDSGGAVYINLESSVTEPVRIVDSLFSDNSTNRGSGGALVVYSSAAAQVFIDNTDFDSNTTLGTGGAVFAYAKSGYTTALTITDSTLSGNSSGDDGGAIYANDEISLTVDSTTLTGNRSNDYGGAIYTSGDTTLTHATFQSNYAANHGGAVYKTSSNTDLTVTSTTFTDDSTPEDGGAIMVWEVDDLVVSDSTFTGGYAANGGAVYIESANGSVQFDGSRFASNEAADHGGALYVRSGFLVPWSMNSSTVIGNTAGSYGGGIYIAGGSGTVSNSFVSGNRGAYGGAIWGRRDLTLNFTTVYGNTSSAVPGEVYLSGSPTLAVSGSLVASCYVVGATVDDTFAVSTDASCGFTGTGSVENASAAALALAADDTQTINGVQQTSRLPGVDSILVSGAPSSALGTGITEDQLGVARSGLFTIGSRQQPASPTPPPPPPTYPPSSPRDAVAVAGDKQASVSWQTPASSGSFPISRYQVTSSPAGGSCLTASLSCTISGLTNGVEYTFAVRALNGAGWSTSATSNPVTPSGNPAPIPAPPVQPLPAPLTPGESLLQTNGAVDPNVEVDPNAQDNGLRITGDNWSMDLDGLGPDGKPLNLGPDGSLRLANERDVATEGTGFLPNSDVDLYVDPPVLLSGAATRMGAQSEEGIYVGTLRTDSRGNFSGTATLPEDIEPGEHVLQAVGYSPTAQVRALSLGVIVERWIVLDQGTRKADGRHDRIRTTGSSGGIDAGVKLTPWIRYSGQQGFKQGVATITVQSDGSFKWTRQIRKSKGLTAYVSYLDTESNRVFWAKVR